MTNYEHDGEDEEFWTEEEDLLWRISRAAVRGSEAIARVRQLEADVAYWRGMYNRCLDESIRHGEAMQGNLLSLLLKAEK